MGKFSLLLTLIIEVWIYIPNARSVATKRTSNMFLETILQLLDYGVNFWFQGRRAHLSMPLSLLWYRQIVELMSLIPATSHESSYFVWQFGCYGKKGTKSCSSIVTLNTIYKKICIQRHANILSFNNQNRAIQNKWQILWHGKCPPVGWWNLNTNGSALGCLGWVGVRGMIKDEWRHWTKGFTRFLGGANNIITES